MNTSTNILEPLLLKKREEIRKIAAEHGAFNIRVFGSAARGEARPDSDIDLLVETGPETSSWFPAGLILDLEKLLNRRVEIVTYRGLSPFLRDRVLQEAVPL
ncbi:MAG: nucleotidyltransferase family protein [bacterium]|nr:nucleotidyltransferase family protein [bacterium]